MSTILSRMPQRTIYTKEILEPVVRSVFSWAALLDHFGKQHTGGNYNAFQRRIKRFELDVTHFKGQGWSRGHTKLTHPGVASNRIQNSKVLSQLQAGTLNDRVHGTRLKTFLLEAGIPYACSIPTCGLSTWLENPISLDVDHINGDNTNQTLSNLRFLCPNCHRQTANWGSRNHKKQK